jgi:hypothetical protein
MFDSSSSRAGWWSGHSLAAGRAVRNIVALELEARSRHSGDMKESIITARPPEDQLQVTPVRTLQQL